ncbi:MAG TPA: hypothetical protein VMD76_11195, partial [Candidatus Sulfotelmatobacter sp.]|nr:hypothetical protein [Candidatus Sulfotelmatobacter sp.]
MKSSSFHLRYITRLVFSATILFAAFASAQSRPARVSYNIALTNPDRHIVDVQITLPPGPASRELQLPVWNALYQVRDFSQYVDWIHAKDRAGKPLAVREINDSRWQIEGASGGAIVNYELYADASSPFGAQLNAHHAFFNLAEILMYPLDGRNSVQAVRFSGMPADWKIATPLKSSGNEKNEKDGKDEFVAETYDRLVDSPVEIGTFQESDFDESGGHFRVIVDADPADYDMTRIVADLHKITAAAISWMNDRPFDSYMFLYHFPRGPAGGGMEHAYSTAIDLNAETLTHSLYPLTAVTAHEFFHLWNVKRIRPQTLEPVDYTKENFTRALWFSEGVTSTVEEWIQLRAGLLEEKQFLGNMSDEITELEKRPARL